MHAQPGIWFQNILDFFKPENAGIEFSASPLFFLSEDFFDQFLVVPAEYSRGFIELYIYKKICLMLSFLS